MLASLNIHGKTKIIEKIHTRDHTERMMKYLNINFKIKKLRDGSKEIELNGPYEIISKKNRSCKRLKCFIFYCRCAHYPWLKNYAQKVMINPTRIAFLKY